MMGQLHAQQGEAMRRQAEFQTALTGLIRQMQEDQATLLSSHLERTESIQQELAALRQELDRRLGGTPAPEPALPRAEPLNIDPAPKPSNPDASTSWLIGRINQLEEESRSSWRDLLGRLTGAAPAASPPDRGPQDRPGRPRLPGRPFPHPAAADRPTGPPGPSSGTPRTHPGFDSPPPHRRHSGSMGSADSPDPGPGPWSAPRTVKPDIPGISGFVRRSSRLPCPTVNPDIAPAASCGPDPQAYPLPLNRTYFRPFPARLLYFCI